jgi:hypothetical protein
MPEATRKGAWPKALALELAVVVGGGVILFGSALALVGLAQPPRRWGLVGLALNVAFPLLCYCSYLVLGPLVRPPLGPKTQPSAFLVWCRDNNFGEKSPPDWINAMPDAHDGFPYRTEWDVRQKVTTPCKTEDEARKYQEAAVAELQRAACALTAQLVGCSARPTRSHPRIWGRAAAHSRSGRRHAS